MTDKRKTLVKHAIRRFYDRHGFHLQESDITFMVKMINASASIRLERQSDRVSVHQIIYRGKLVTVVYDKVRKVIVTTLPDKEQADVQVRELPDEVQERGGVRTPGSPPADGPPAG